MLWDSLVQIVHEHTGISPLVFANLVMSIFAILFYLAARLLIINIIVKKTTSLTRRYNGIKTAKYALGILLLLILTKIWLGSTGGLLTYFGIVSAGLAVALQSPIMNFAGWLFIIWRKPFASSDRIQIGDTKGDVIDIRLFQFTLIEIGNWVDAEQSTGRIVHVPNGKIFTESISNYTQGFKFIWNEISVMLTFESNWEKAKDILKNIATRYAAVDSKAAEREIIKASERFLILYSHLTPIVWTDVKDSGVVLTMRYTCMPRERRSTATAIWEDVLKSFAKEDDIDFAYPTQRMYFNAIEGKKDARADLATIKQFS